MDRFVCAVDVGTGSARAGIFDITGRRLGRAESAIAIHEPLPGRAEHGSEQIWAAVCDSVRAARQSAGVAADQIAGIGFDATCSLVLRGQNGAPLALSPGRDPPWDTIAWLDHRALAEADECTATGHRVLREAGGAMSPEMQIPKLMWLKRNRPELWAETGYLFDLVDFLTWRASGSLARSHCTLTCKWTYLPQGGGWQPDFLKQTGLSDLLARGSLPETSTAVGRAVGALTSRAAGELGLTPDVMVGAGLIDAHAGALGVLADLAATPGALGRHLALIAGTSSCIMTLSPEPRTFAGGWGPYFGATTPDLWVSEGGQSASGALLDHLIRGHAAGGAPDAAAHQRIVTRIQELRLAQGRNFAARLHVLPDFHGNRTPLGDPHALGVISGLTLDASLDGLCRLYFRACVAIALGVRHVLEGLDGEPVERLHVTGGHTKNPLLMELYADATGVTLVEPADDDAVLLGSAMIAASAGGLYPDLAGAGTGMRQSGRERSPDPRVRDIYDRDYRIFLEMHRQRRALDAMI